jgi:peptidase A4-like protein
MRKLPSLRLPAVGALLASATLVSASLMMAAPVTAGQGFGPHLTFGGPLSNAGNWAGYAASGQTFTTIVGHWVEPQVTCNGSALYAPWVGIDGFNDQTVEQTGVQTECSGGSPQVSGWYEMYPAAPVYFSNPASIGDHFTAKVQHTGGTTYKLTLTDNTKGWSHTVTKNLSAQNASAEAIIEAPGGFPGIPGGVTFTGVKVDGQSLASFSPTKLTATGGWTPGPLSGGTFTIKHT